MASNKYATILNGVVDVISFDPDRELIIEYVETPILGENGEPAGETERVEVSRRWGDVLPPWVEVPDDVFAGFILNGDGSFSAPPPVVIPDPTEWTIATDVPWERMTDEEAEDVDDGIQASPVKTRNVINKATSFTTGTEAFTKFFAIIETATSATRAHEIMKWLSAEETLSAEQHVAADM